MLSSRVLGLERIIPTIPGNHDLIFSFDNYELHDAYYVEMTRTQ